MYVHFPDSFSHIYHIWWLRLSLVRDLVDKCAHMRKELDRKLVAGFEKLLGALCCPDARWGAGKNNGTGGQGSALRQEANKLGNVEDKVAIENC